MALMLSVIIRLEVTMSSVNPVISAVEITYRDWFQ